MAKDIKNYQKKLVSIGQTNIFDFIVPVKYYLLVEKKKKKYYISFTTKMKGYIGFKIKIFLDQDTYLDTIMFPTKCKMYENVFTVK